MDDQHIGRVLRALRHRLAWRQVDVAVAAGLTQDDISRAERGRLRDVSKLRRHGAALDAEVFLSIRWRGGEIDRLLDEGHAAIVGWVVATLVGLGWEVMPEVSYSIRGERGSIDILAWHAESRTLLVVEVKSELTSIEETLRKHDAKQRLAPVVAKDRFGWSNPSTVCRLLVLPESSTSRRRAERHAAVLDQAYRLRGAAARSWLANPSGGSSLIIFAPFTRQARLRRGSVSRKRIRSPRATLEPTRPPAAPPPFTRSTRS
jgi:transcriptional regulator with XRE-family HTH domain